MKFKTGNKIIDFMIASVVILVWITLMVFMSKGIFNLIYEPKPVPTDMTFMLTPYLGLPYIFWMFTSIGVMLGLFLHGFVLVSVSSKTNTKNE